MRFTEFRQALATLAEDNPCWKGYTQRGMKKKGKRTVPNCVKESTEIHEIAMPKSFATIKQRLASGKDAAKRGAKVLARKIKERGAVPVHETTLHELNKSTLRRYVDKAVASVYDSGKKTAFDAMKSVQTGKPSSTAAVKKFAKRSRGITNATRKLAEGSAQGGVTKRMGHLDANNPSHVAKAKAAGDATDRKNKVVVSPNTDARKYARDHITPHNKGEHSSSSDRAGRRKDLRKKPTPPAQQTAASNHRMMDILNHPHYKKLANKE